MDPNKKYEILRFCVISAFSNEKFLEIQNVTVDDFQPIMKFVKDMYYTYFKYVERDKV